MSIGLGKNKEPLVHINAFAIKGEKGTGFEKRGKKGPFECGNCEYFKDGSCGQKDMMEKSKEPKLANGRIKVAAEDCCEYIEREG
jgi:hypothetical protein